MTCTRRHWSAAAVFVVASLAVASARNQDKGSNDNERPRVVLRAQPTVGVAPARVVFTAEIQGGADDFEEFYCAAVEWDWGDDTKSESTVDCEPYQPGRSVIRRRFTIEHRFNRAGGYKVYFRLKRRDKIVGAAATTVQIRPGGRDFEF